MKRKSFLVATCLVAVSLLSSCYTTTVSVGNMNMEEASVEVNTAHNAHFIGGLIGQPSVEDQDYVGDAKEYCIKNYTSFKDGLVSTLTLGIYSPSTTKFYLPYGTECSVKNNNQLPPIQFGVRGGLNFSNFSEKDDDRLEGRTGLKAGVIVDIPIEKHLYIQPGLYYSQKGMKHESEDDYDEHKFRANYIEIPLLLSGRIDVAQNFQLQLNYGPYIAYCINDAPALTYKLDYGLQIGAGLLVMRHFYVGCSYDLGFGIVDTGSSHDMKSKTRNFSVNVGFNL